MRFFNKFLSSTKMVLTKLIVISFLFISASVFALDLHDAKKQGLVGETVSGYLGAVSSQRADVSILVNNINALRRTHYERIAGKNSIPVKDVELLAGKKALQKTAAGEYVKVKGVWRKK